MTITFGYNELKHLPAVKEGDRFQCRRCGCIHNLNCAINAEGEKTTALMFYRCRGNTYLGVVNGRLVVDKIEK